jgi:O-methyltransferase
MKAGLAYFIPRLSPGGLIFAHDYSSGYFPGCAKAVDEYSAEHRLSVTLLPDKSGTAVFQKPG